jgi:hypothetical protein
MHGDMFFSEVDNFLYIEGDDGNPYKIVSASDGQVHLDFGPTNGTIEEALAKRHHPRPPQFIRVQYQPAVEIREITVTASLSGDAIEGSLKVETNGL